MGKGQFLYSLETSYGAQLVESLASMHEVLSSIRAVPRKPYRSVGEVEAKGSKVSGLLGYTVSEVTLG